MVLKLIGSFVFFMYTIVQVESVSKCDLAHNCKECIGYPENCVWCSEPNMQERRCTSKSYSDRNRTWCNGKPYHPKDSMVLTRSDSLTSKTPLQVQITPQEVIAKLRPGIPHQFSIKYKSAHDYPLDVYYLLDSTNTMSNFVEQLKNNSEVLYQSLIQTTNNVHFGLGTFSEKPARPYSSNKNLDSFRNFVTLTNNITAFQEAFKEITPGNNLDDPEASLDALMQVMVCDKQLHWRPSARRIIVLLTDGPFHTDGDGKMLGIIRPNDRQCHLENNRNKMELQLDYPSISQINKEASDRAFTIIMAVKNPTVFENFAARISGSKLVELKKNSNVVNLIIKEYKNLLSTVEFQSKVLLPHISVKLTPYCSSSSPCQIGHNETLEMNATVTINSCPSTLEAAGSTISVGRVGLTDEIQIQVKALCDCECEKSVETRSEYCNKQGNYSCGICQCNKNWFGDACQTYGESVDGLNTDKCKGHKDDKFLCNSNGICNNGVCNCHKKYSGYYCQFYDEFCPQPRGKMCSGNGKCIFNKCECFQNLWVGEDCKCPNHDRDCIAPYSSEVCSGRGTCVCGECDCTNNDGNQSFAGVFCGECNGCTEKRCIELEDYAECNFFNDESFCEEKFNKTSDLVRLFKVNTTEINAVKWKILHRCKKTLTDGSGIIFKYTETPTKILLVVLQTEKEEAPKANMWFTIGSVIGAVVLIGILTGVIWRVILYCYDVREYNKFSEMAAAEGYDFSTENPYYKPPKSEFRNPTYSVKN